MSNDLESTDVMGNGSFLSSFSCEVEIDRVEDDSSDPVDLELKSSGGREGISTISSSAQPRSFTLPLIEMMPSST